MIGLSCTIGSASIIQSNAIKMFGVTLTDNLSWNTQAKQVQSVVNSMIGVLQRFSSSLNTDAQLKILNAFILPSLLTVSRYGAMDQQLLHLNLTVVSYNSYVLH